MTRGGATEALEPRAHEMQRVLGRIEQHRAAPDGGKAAQARRAARDGDEQVEGEEALAALGLAADDAHGLVGPQILDEPAPLGRTDRQLARARHGQHGQRVRLGRGRGRSGAAGAKRSKKSCSSSCGRSRSAPARSNSWAWAIKRAGIARGVIDQGVEEAGRQQVRIAGLVQDVPQALREVLARGGVEQEPGAEATLEGEQLGLPQAGLQPAVAGQDDREDHAGVEVGAGEQPDLGQHVGVDVLRFVDEQHGPGAGCLEMRAPGVAQRFGAGPAIVRAQGDAEEVPELAIEVGDAGLRAREDADHDIAQGREARGEQAQGDGFAGAGVAEDDGEAALAREVLDAPAEAARGGRGRAAPRSGRRA